MIIKYPSKEEIKGQKNHSWGEEKRNEKRKKKKKKRNPVKQSLLAKQEEKKITDFFTYPFSLGRRHSLLIKL